MTMSSDADATDRDDEGPRRLLIPNGETRGARRDRLRTTLMREWDPIGVADIPEASDEYDAYLDGLLDLLDARQGVDAVTAYLWALESEHMGLTGDCARTARSAARLVDGFANDRTG